MQVAAYIIACEGCTVEAMLAASKAFLQGKVKRERNTFAPSSAEFADRARYEQLVIDASHRPRLAKAVEVAETFSPEHQEQMKHKWALLQRATRGDRNAAKELQGMVSPKTAKALRMMVEGEAKPRKEGTH